MTHRTDHIPVPRVTHRRVVTLRISVVISALTLLSACGGRSEPTAIEASSANAQAARVATESTAQAPAVAKRSAEAIGTDAAAVAAGQRGVLLTGLPGDNAYEALQFYAVVNRQTAATKQPTSAPTPSTPLKATLDPAATVGQVNAALDAVGARIVSMTPRNKTVTLAMSPIGGDALTSQQVAASLLASRAFKQVQGPGLPVLPEEVTIDPDVAERLRHDGPSS
jgi:hypothetical protein